MLIVYLAGGMVGDWQDKVKAATEQMYCEVVCLDPRRNGTKKSQEYSTLDKYHIRRSHVVFVYIEADNPSGIGSAYELGLADAYDKTIILVNEKRGDRHFHILEERADVVFDNLDDGIAFLQRLQV